MSTLQRFFNYHQSLDRRDETLLGDESNLYLFAKVISRKPLNLLNIGVGPGDVALTLTFAKKAYAGTNLICMQPAKTESEIDPHLLSQLEQDGVVVIPDVDLDAGEHEAIQCLYDLIAVDLSKISTTVDLPRILALLKDDAQLFLYASVATEKQILFAETERLLPQAEWHIDVITRQGAHEGVWVPDMLAVQPLSHRGDRRILRDNATGTAPDQHASATTIFLALPPPANTFGWGLCSRYLSAELGKLHPVHVLDDTVEHIDSRPLPGKVFHALTGIRFESIFEQARGEENYAYTFFENELLPESVENAKKYDLVLGGSTWCMERMREKGINNSDVLIQGIDPRYFYPINTSKSPEKFVIFSGGKFEPRKGQDLVLAAFKALQDKYPDLVLVNCWHNLWPQSMDLMADSKLIQYERKGEEWSEIMGHIYALNKLDQTRIFTIDLVPNETQRDLYRKTDIGLFPNRCEGGTNLVLMEYMACGKPVIGAYSTGQKDVLSADNALLLEEIRPYEIKGPDGTLIARWTEPSLEELIAQIEFAYQNRDRIKQLGRRAGEDLQQMTWAHSAKSLLRTMGYKSIR